MMACRICARERRIGLNEVAGRARAGLGFGSGRLEDNGTTASAGSGGGVAATGAGATSSTKTGSGKGGGETSSGVVTSGGNGCTQLRLIFFGGGPATGRGEIVRGRTGGGGCEPKGIPSASRKRRTLSSSLSGGARRIGSRGEGGLGFLASPEPWLNHLKISARPARTRNMTVSFTCNVEGQKLRVERKTFVVRRLPSAVSQLRRSLPA